MQNLGFFDTASAQDLLPSEANAETGRAKHMIDAGGRKDGDAGAVKKPIFGSRCVYIVNPTFSSEFH
jgi:hypothetical protein